MDAGIAAPGSTGLAVAGDRAAVVSLWRMCFDDGEDYAGGIFDLAMLHGAACVARMGGEIVASLALLPFRVAGGGVDTGECLYLYALCTAPWCRGRGIAGRLLAFAEEVARIRKCQAIFLQSGTEGLVAFYRRAGFRPASWRIREMAAADGAERGGEPPEGTRRIGASEYNSSRERLLADVPHAVYGDWWVDFAGRVFSLGGGGLFAVGEGGVAAIECMDGNGRPVAWEFLPAGRRDASALRGLLSGLGSGDGILFRPAVEAAGGELQLMVRWLDGESPQPPSFGMPFSLE